ncbi:hypothetical protein [Noviherbaspirillum sp.]|uniref:hypothetical protein n=1 Tax=Noviherbaspirillum sp. TaxID=1926288 RepID=UPI003FA5A9AB
MKAIDAFQAEVANVVDRQGNFKGTTTPVREMLMFLAMRDDDGFSMWLDGHPEVSEWQCREILRLSEALIMAVVATPQA